MSIDQNKALIRSFIDTWNRGDLKGLAAFWAPSVIHHARFQSHGLEGILATNEAFMAAFPDLRFRIDDMVAEGDRVVTRLTCTATHEGSFLGIEPTGREVSCGMIQIARIADGKIVEHWGLTDELYLLEQVGMVPSEALTAMP